MDSDEEAFLQQRDLLVVSAYAVVSLVGLAATLYASPHYWKQPMHNSALSGEAWVQELIKGNPERIHRALGMNMHVFLALAAELRLMGYQGERDRLSMEEQLAIFLYTAVTGLSLHHVEERFQHSGDTINKYFKKFVNIFSSAPFYTTYVKLPTSEHTVPQHIQEDPRLYPYFRNALGALDGTHIASNPPLEYRQASRNRKGFISQNCLACTDFDLRFQYFLSGWEGSTADASLYNTARNVDFRVPEGKYYLGDGGFGFSDYLLLPYTGVRYHLAEWARAVNLRPANKEELFNLRHAQLRNAVERIFGVVKKRWRILSQPPHLNLEIQARIPCALAAVHNYILELDPTEMSTYTESVQQERAGGYVDPDPAPVDIGQLQTQQPDDAEVERSKQLRDQIAEEMWTDYVRIRAERGEPVE